MKKILRRWISFFTFDIPNTEAYNRLHLHVTHKQYLLRHPDWDVSGTRQKLIADYWYGYVVYHFLFIIGLALSVTLSFTSYFTLLYLSILCLACGISFGIIYFCIYLPSFSSEFLPQLETLVANYKRKHVEAPQTKSSKTQAKIPTLTIIHFILMEMAGIARIACDDESAKALNVLTGLDTGSIKDNLRRIYQPSKLTPREQAEISKGIIAARSYFAKLNHPPAFKILDRLERKLQGG